MPPVAPICRRDLITTLRRLGFAGPFSGGNHEFMTRAAVRVILPNPHASSIGQGFLLRILKQAGVDRSEWEAI
jgi:predicted RNA binding protein YcfA (HicA-like mRNA interferase family)